jgi:hypothetical protein
MSSRKRMLVVLGLGGLAVVALLVAWFIVPSEPSARGLAARIQPGMCRQDVEAILGRPADIGLDGTRTMRMRNRATGFEGQPVAWAVRDGHLVIAFDEEDRVGAVFPRFNEPSRFREFLSRLLP